MLCAMEVKIDSVQSSNNSHQETDITNKYNTVNSSSNAQEEAKIAVAGIDQKTKIYFTDEEGLKAYITAASVERPKLYAPDAPKLKAENVDPTVQDEDFVGDSGPYFYNEIFHKTMGKLLTSSHELESNRTKILIENDARAHHWQTLQKIGDLFVHNVSKYGKIIIEEQNVPDDKKTIQKSSAGGIAGGEKFKVNGILFKFAHDTNLGPLWLYGDNERNDQFAAKAAGQELLSANYVGSRHPQLRIPLMALLDYWGQRLIGMALLPIGNHSILYGSDNAGIDVHADKRVAPMMDEIGKSLNLKKHTVNNARMALCGDIEVHVSPLAKESCFYCIDTARVFPPEAPSSSSPNRQSVFYEKLRPEFVQGYTEPLSSDAFSRFQDSSEAKINNNAIKQATTFLLDEHLKVYLKTLTAPETIERLLKSTGLEFYQYGSFGRSSQNQLIKDIHAHGFNIRHLGYIYNELVTFSADDLQVSPLTFDRLKRFVFNVMVSRILKNYARKLLRETITDIYEYKKLLITIMNNIIQMPPQFQQSIDGLVEQKFGPLVTLKTWHQGFLLFEFCRAMGIVLHPMTHSALLSNYNERLHLSFSFNDIIDIQPTIKYLNHIDLASGILGLREFNRFKKQSRGSTTVQDDVNRNLNLNALDTQEKLEAALITMGKSFKTMFGVEDVGQLSQLQVSEPESVTRGRAISRVEHMVKTDEFLKKRLLRTAPIQYLQDWDVQTKISFSFPVHQLLNAITDADSRGIKLLAREFQAAGRDIKELLNQDLYAGTPLHYAVHKQNKGIIALLLSFGAEIDTEARDGEGTPLLCAVKDGIKSRINHDTRIKETSSIDTAFDLARFLLWHDASVQAITHEKETALHIAAAQGNKQLVQLLLAHGASVNSKTVVDFTPLHYALSQQDPDLSIIRMLLKKGANRDAHTRTGLKPVDLTESANGDWDGYLRTLENQKRRKIQLHKDFFQACLLGNSIQLAELLVKNDGHGAIDVNVEDEQGKTGLMLASEKGHLEIVRKLCSLPGIAINAQDGAGRTALMFAIQNNYREIVQELLDSYGIDLSIQDNDNKTALAYANASRHAPNQAPLIEAHRSLIIAARDGNLKQVKELLKNSLINPHAKEAAGRNALWLAVAHNHLAVVRELLTIPGIEVNVQDQQVQKIGYTLNASREGYSTDYQVGGLYSSAIAEWGNTPLIVAAYKEGFVEIVHELLKMPNINTNLQNSAGKTALHYAVLKGHLEIVTALCFAADLSQVINKCDLDGDTPLIIAARHNQIGIVKELLKRRSLINVNAQNKKGKTALIVAIEHDNSELTMILCKVDSLKVNVPDNDSNTPLILAAQRDSTGQIVHFLLQVEGIAVNMQNKEDNTALIVAAKKAFPKQLKY